MSAQDTLDRLSGIAGGSALDALRRERPVTRDNAQAGYEALFEADDETGVSRSERLTVAAFVALLHADGPGVEHYARLLEGQPGGAALSGLIRRQAEHAATRGPYGAYPPGPLSREDVAGPVFKVAAAASAELGERLSAALEHTHLLVFHPRDAKAADLAALKGAGWSTAGAVTLSQIVAFLSFQIRAAHGLRALGA
ncbi:CMD domain protein [Bosea caraganae]|uniref:CMD domain protein n=1 Tax=Bosea caraganae TaxID=2763117 RepID=A0A370LCL1_9HYPH|nr:CMD domain protein [Bosea caraganae]RDJ27700.1 CMD domain protein [Bosea caraganae]RDJ29713.1 CMD domain protein [Bosea caraganae]